jgi:hypothetical protein
MKIPPAAPSFAIQMALLIPELSPVISAACLLSFCKSKKIVVKELAHAAVFIREKYGVLTMQGPGCFFISFFECNFF